MPYEIDQEALESPNIKILDLGKPPLKTIPFQAYPKMVYLHPKDKTKEHRAKIVNSPEELEAAERQGYKVKPHIPVDALEDLSEEFEAEPLEARRGPGRPKVA
jgi:hypothetical protein